MEVLRYKYEINLDSDISCSGCGRYIPMGFWLAHDFCSICGTHRYFCDRGECNKAFDSCISCERDRKLGDILNG